MQSCLANVRDTTTLDPNKEIKAFVTAYE